MNSIYNPSLLHQHPSFTILIIINILFLIGRFFIYSFLYKHNTYMMIFLQLRYLFFSLLVTMRYYDEVFIFKGNRLFLIRFEDKTTIHHHPSKLYIRKEVTPSPYSILKLFYYIILSMNSFLYQIHPSTNKYIIGGIFIIIRRNENKREPLLDS